VNKKLIFLFFVLVILACGGGGDVIIQIDNIDYDDGKPAPTVQYTTIGD